MKLDFIGATKQCPNCTAERVKVLDSRFDVGPIRRRRLCLNCQHRWTTYEIREDDLGRLIECRSSPKTLTLALYSAQDAISSLLKKVTG